LIIMEKNYIIIKRGRDMVTFFDRLGAYFIDIVIVSLLLGLVSYGLPSNTNDLNNQVAQLEEQYVNNEITTDVYLEKTYDLLYEIQDSSKLSSFVGLAFTIAYFVVFQSLYNGQTFGKKLLRLKVVDAVTNENVGVGKLFLRSLFTLSVVSSSCNLILLLFFSKSMYLTSYMIISSVELLFIVVTIVMILYRKDKRGLHDLMTRTCVIKEI